MTLGKVTESQSHRVTNPHIYRVLQVKKQVCDFVTLVFKLLSVYIQFFIIFFIFLYYFIKIRVTESQNTKKSPETLDFTAFQLVTQLVTFLFCKVTKSQK